MSQNEPDVAAAGSVPRPRQRDTRVNRHRHPATYTRPADPATQTQRDRITHLLTEMGLTEREQRLARISQITGRPIPALAALSLADAAAILHAIDPDHPDTTKGQP